MANNPETQGLIDRFARLLWLMLWVLLLVTIFFGRQSKWLAVVNIVFSAVSLILWVKFPQYFSKGSWGFFEWTFYSANKSDIMMCCVLPLMVLATRANSDFVIGDLPRLLAVTLLASAVLGAAIWILSGKRSVKFWTAVGLSAAIYMSMIGVCVQLNYVLDGSSADTQLCRVVDLEEKHHYGRRRMFNSSTDYYCVVETETGEQMKIPISTKQYNTLRRGTVISVYSGDGAFGVEYTYILHDASAAKKKNP